MDAFSYLSRLISSLRQGRDHVIDMSTQDLSDHITKFSHCSVTVSHF